MAQSYFQAFDPKLQEAGQPVPPLGSLIAAAVLRDRGFDVAFFDAMLASCEAECGALMDRVRPAALVIFEDNFNYLSKMCLGRMRQAAARMIGMAREREIVVVVAGSDASDDPAFYLRAGASAVARGEGEITVAEWLETRSVVPGIVTMQEDGSLNHAPARPPIRDVDSLPSPAWELIDIPRYRNAWMARHGFFSLPLATSRGCPFHCNWCAKPIWGQRYNAMSPLRAAREVVALKAKGATHVNVLDDIFGLRSEWLETFGEELRRLGSVLPFKCLSRADLLSDRTIRALASAGCEMVWIGAESGSQKVLDAMEKGTTVWMIREAAARLRTAGVRIGLFIQFGYPGETREDIAATIELIEDVLPDDIGVSVSYPLPGTRFHDRVRHEMGNRRHWGDSSDLAMLFGGLHGTRFYRCLHTYAHARFRLARALRCRDRNFAARCARIVRYGVTRSVAAFFLALAARDRLQMRALAPQLSRGAAATPAFDAVAPGEP